jgi:hypothetical protein
MIALFDEPVRVSLLTGWVGAGRVGLLMGMVKEGASISGLVVLEDGSVSLVDSLYFNVDWRYDATKDRWMSRDALETDQV